MGRALASGHGVDPDVRTGCTSIQIEDKTNNLSPAMAATVEPKTGSRRIIEYLLSALMRYRHDSLRER